MKECPKCGASSFRIIGPQFIVIDGFERLQYICATCGYRTTTATKDANQKGTDGETP